MNVASVYQQILALSRQMLETGMAQNWDKLVELEAQRHGLFAQIAGQQLSPAMAPVLQEIKHCDDELREKVEAWLGHAKILLRMKDS